MKSYKHSQSYKNDFDPYRVTLRCVCPRWRCWRSTLLDCGYFTGRRSEKELGKTAEVCGWFKWVLQAEFKYSYVNDTVKTAIRRSPKTPPWWNGNAWILRGLAECWQNVSARSYGCDAFPVSCQSSRAVNSRIRDEYCHVLVQSSQRLVCRKVTKTKRKSQTKVFRQFVGLV